MAEEKAPQRWTAPSDSGYVASTEAEAALIRQIKELHARPYVDPRLRELSKADEPKALPDADIYIDPARKDGPVIIPTRAVVLDEPS